MHSGWFKAKMQKTNSLNFGSDNRWYALLVFFSVSVFNYLDRTILSILQVPVKHDLGLSDSQMGALTGLAFAVFYTTFSLPIARLYSRLLPASVRPLDIAERSAFGFGSGQA